MDRRYRPVCMGCGKSFAVRQEGPGLFRYRSWLPLERAWENRSVPAAFRSWRLGKRLGMRDLWIVFSGYWPERGAFLESCSFKELEALPVLARMPASASQALVVSSAGNTGRAFLQAGSALGFPVVVVALAGLMKALRQGAIDPSSPVLLNLTGGGRRRLEQDRRVVPVEPDCTVGVEEIDRPERVREALARRPVAMV